MARNIPVSVVVATLNEAHRLPSCLAALQSFDEIIVVDSGSTDGTADTARSFGARVVPYQWNGRYPKKRQWCLDTLELKHDRVFFVDADEIMTPSLCAEIAALDWQCAGYFVTGLYRSGGKTLRFGVPNTKLALIDRRKIEFPVVDDLDIPGMGEIEGHYQPVLKDGYEGEKLGRLRAPLLHEAELGEAGWQERHARYARWEAGMNAKEAWPRDPVVWRQKLKTAFRRLPLRPLVYFIYAYIIRLGVLDGRQGFDLAFKKASYYRLIKRYSPGNRQRTIHPTA